MNTIFGKQIGRYILLEKLGEGGMAAVYNAYDSRLERNVALKVILPSRQSSQLFLERFAIEARALAQLSHTNIVKVLDYGEEDGAPFLVMEFIQGGTLKEFLDQPMPYQQAAAILAPIARALDYVHKQKIIHRDVKPSNILIGENDAPMLSDFGVIKLLETSEENDLATGVGIGTPDYMSPEQGMGKEVDFRADIYALGVVFYEMITGQKPFSAETPMALVIQHVTGAFPRPRAAAPKLPQIVEDVLMKAVAKDPQKRYAEMADFAEALEQLARGEDAQVKRIRKLLRPRKQPRQPRQPGPRVPRRYVLYANLALLVVLAVALVLLWQPLMRSPFGAPVSQFLAQYLPQPAPTVVSGLPAAELPDPTATAQPTQKPKPQSSPTRRPTAKPSPTPASAPAEPTQADSGASSSGTSSIVDSPAPALVGTPIAALSDAAVVPASQRQVALWGIGGVNTGAWSKDMRSIALATSDGIFIYDAQTFKRTRFIDTQEWVELLLFTDDGQYLTAGLRSGKVYSWDVSTWKVAYSVDYQKPRSERIGQEATSAVKSIAYSSNQRLMAVGYDNGALTLWSLTGDQPEAVFTAEQYKTVSGLYFSDDSRYIYTTNADKQFIVWDISQKKSSIAFEFPAPVSTIISSADGRYLLLGGVGSSVFLFDPGQPQPRLMYSFLHLGAAVRGISASADNRLLAFGLANGAVKVYAMPDDEGIKVIQKELLSLPAHPDAVTSLAFASDSQSLLTTSWMDGLRTWNPQTGEQSGAIDENTSQIKRMVFSPDSKWLVAEDVDGVVRILNTLDGSLVQAFDATLPTGPVFSQSGRQLVLGQKAANHWDMGQLLVVEYPSAEVIKTLTGYRDDLTVSFSPDEKILLSGSKQTAIFWDTSTWEKMRFHGGSMTSCGEYYTPDNQRLATIWNNTILFAYNDRVSRLCTTQPDFASPLGLLADQQGAIFQLINGRIWVWNLSERAMTDMRNIKNYAGSSGSKDVLLAVSNDTKTMVVARAGKDILVSSQNSGTINGNVSYPRFVNTAVYQYTAAVAPNNRIVALASQFGTITLWII